MTPPRRLPSNFSCSAAYPLFAFDPGQDRAWVLHFGPDDYRRASFLDQRALTRQIPGWALSHAELNGALDAATEPHQLHWLFHIGHCGSTLVSRLLDLVPGVLGLREPLPLLALAHGRDDAATTAWQAPVLALLARGFDDTRAVIVKPTSLVTVLTERLLSDSDRASLLWIDLQTWLATMLRDAELVDGVLATEPLRLAGLDLAADADGDGERLARAWLAEQLRWRRLTDDPARAARLIDLDFADVLADPAGAVARLAAHYGLDVPADWQTRIADSGLLDRYAKNEAQVFNAQTRKRELAEAADRHADAIAAGLRWAGDEIGRLELDGFGQRLRPRD